MKVVKKVGFIIHPLVESYQQQKQHVLIINHLSLFDVQKLNILSISPINSIRIYFCIIK